MARHRGFKLSFIRQLQIRQFDVQCIEFMKVTMPTNRWTRTAKANHLPIIFALKSSGS